MARSELEVQVKGAKELLAGIRKLENNIKNSGDLANEVGAALFARIRRRFIDDQVDPDGTKWEISAASIQRGGKTGFDTGRLFHSMQLFQDSPTVQRIGTDVPYARSFQEGGEGQPSRVFLGFGDSDERFAEAVIKKAVDRALEDIS